MTAMNAPTTTAARIIVTGGTFDKHYDAIKGELTFKETHLPAILEQARVTLPLAIEIRLLIDSLQMTDAHRAERARRVPRRARAVHRRGPRHRHDGADRGGRGRGGARQDVVFTGAMIPYSVQGSDAPFNLGFALAMAQALPPNAYVAMNGRVFAVGQRAQGQGGRRVPVRPMTSLRGTFRSLGGFNYRLWAAGALVSNIGTWMQRTAQDWIVLTELTA